VTALSGRVALVTGASRGIGAATAVELAKRGAHVVLIARTQGGLEETDDAVRAAGGTATLLPLDLMKGDGIDPLGPTLHARFGRLDILVHNAGVLGKLTPVAADPHLRAAVDGERRGPRGVCDQLGGERAAGVLGRLCGKQGGDGNAGAGVGGRNRGDGVAGEYF
jgi:NAD(P)-dependent dehydrogenase (short-subunit alcohol dehydrogenase family)